MFRSILDARLRGCSGLFSYQRRFSVVTWVSSFVAVSYASVEHARRALISTKGCLKLCWDVFTSDFQSPAGCFTEMSTVQGYNYDPPRFTLDRFSDDHTRAFFKCEYYTAGKATIFRRLHEKQLVGAPAFSIQIREVVNDTGLPNLQIDDFNEEISFSWIGMLDQLMGEEHVFNTILAQRLGWHLDYGNDEPLNPGDDEPINILTTHRKLARRSRYQRECRAKYGSNILEHYVHDERPALETLQRLRHAASTSNDKNDRDDENDTTANPVVFTRAQILASLPPNTTIYTGNANPSRQPGSIPRGIFTERDYCSPWLSRSDELPPPSTADLFSPRALPRLSWGRRPIRVLSQKQQSKRRRDDGASLGDGGKRAGAVEEDGDGDDGMVEGRKRRRGGREW